MKRFISIFLALSLCSFFAFADDQADEYFDDYVYEQNGKGDQFIKFGLNGFFPLNFGQQLYTGGAIDIGYYRFINRKVALGGEATLSYNLSIGRDVLYTAPFVFGIMYQPEVGKIEFPLTVGAGFGFESWANMTYFPAPALKGSMGAFYRITDGFSLGAEGSLLCYPQWVFEKGIGYVKEKSYTGLFATVNFSVRFHF